jgi:arylformamidase
VISNFSAVTDCQGDLNVLIRELQNAYALCASLALDQGADPNRIHVVGHSSGAHLAASLKVSDWSTLQIEEPPMTSILLVSGMYDLEAVSHSSRSEYVNFTPQIIDAMSPERHLDRFLNPRDLKVTLCCGTLESPEFIRQSDSMHKALKAKGSFARMIWCEGVNHFEILEQLCDQSSEVSQALLSHLNLH